MTEKHEASVRAAVIGAGRMGRVHLEAARRAGCRVVALCDHDPQVLAETGREANIDKDCLHVELNHLLTASAPELVIVATTAESHAALVCAAARAGVRFVLCEKPLAVSLEQCDHMIETCQRVGTKLAINHSGRFRPTSMRVREVVGSEAFGGLRSMTVVGGNAGLVMNGSHLVEAFVYLADEVPAEVVAWLDPEPVRSPRGAGYEDRSGIVRVTTRSGRRLSMDLGADQGHGIVVTYAGRTGWCVEDVIAGRLHVSVRRIEDRGLPCTRYATSAEMDDVQLTPADVVEPAAAMLRALLNGNGYVGGEHGRLALEVLVAAHVSDEGGHMPVDPTAGLPRNRIFAWA